MRREKEPHEGMKREKEPHERREEEIQRHNITTCKPKCRGFQHHNCNSTLDVTYVLYCTEQ
jgi:hypothetical protein